jgi:hypothetical protein
MTLSEAIEWLRSAGLNAQERHRWGIMITVGAPDVSHDITIWPGGVVYIYAEPDGGWTLLDIFFQDSRSRVPDFDIRQRYADLASATHAARDYVERVEANTAAWSRRSG